MRQIQLLLVTFAIFLSQPALAKDHEKWVSLVLTSADLASKAIPLTASSGLSWPDGRQALVTYWKDGIATYRCVDYFDSNMQATGSICYGPSRIAPPR